MPPLPNNPLAAALGAAPTGKLALPPNPLASTLAGDIAHPTPVHAPGPSFAKLPNGKSLIVPPGQKAPVGSTPTVPQPGGGKASEIAGSIIAGAINPIEWGQSAIAGAKQLSHVPHEIAQGNLGKGALDTGLGALGVAAVLPFGRVPKDLAEAVRAGRTAEEAGQHIADAAANARAEGFGPKETGGIGKPPLLKKGETTPGTAGEIGAQVRTALGKAPAARTSQGVLYHEERAARAAAAKVHLDQGNYEAALHELKGALPKVDFQGFKQFDPATQKALEAHVMDHPSLRTYEKINTIEAIRGAIGGKVPTPSDQRLLERAFGKTVSDQITEAAGQINKWPKMVTDLLNVPRSVMASTDLSAPFRQGLVAGVSHPILFAKNFGPMLKAAKSETYFQQMIQDEIHSRPTYPLMEKAKVAFTDIGKDAQHGPAAQYQREEQFMSNYAERVPGFGRVVRGSDRAYVGFLNKIRADIFDHLLQQASEAGVNVERDNFLPSLGRFVNSATGRGSLGKLTNHTATLNALFFAPRLLASRINFLNPLYYAKLDPFVRREALKAFMGLGATAGTILEIAKMGGAKVNTDPTNADFAKIRIGNERVDILGGFQQPIRLAAQLYFNKLTSSTTGNVIPLGTGFAKTSRFDVVLKFLQGKLSPVPAMVVDTLKGQDFTGQPVKWTQLSTYERELANNMVPFLAQDMVSLYQTSGPGAAAASFPLDLFGVGVQDYKAKTPASKGAGASNGFGGDTGSFGNTGGFGGDTGSFGG